MDYFKPITDDNGYVHSIDNVVCLYCLKNYNMNVVAAQLIAIREKHGVSGWEKLNCPACSRYSYFQNTLHMGAIHINFGKYQDFDKINREWFVVPYLRLEVNPNKHHKEPLFHDLLAWISENCSDGILRKYDYAIDVPYPLSAVKVYSSRKEPGLYKKTRYYGVRQKHGFLRIYDKAKEQKLESSEPLTRIEYLFEYGKEPNFDNVAFVDGSVDNNRSGLDSVNECIVSLCQLLALNNIDYEEHIQKLNYRRRKTLEPYLHGDAKMLEYSPEILQALLCNISKLFTLDLSKQDIAEESQAELSEIDGFIHISEEDLAKLPFD